METAKEWRKPVNKKELKPGVRCRYIGIKDGLLSNEDAKRIDQLTLDKKPAAEFISSIDQAVWRYGVVSQSGKYIETDYGGAIAIPVIRMVEILATPKMKWAVSFSSAREPSPPDSRQGA